MTCCYDKIVVWFLVNAKVYNEAIALKAHPAPQLPMVLIGEMIPFVVQSTSWVTYGGVCTVLTH